MSERWTEAEREAFYAQRAAARLAFDQMRLAKLKGNDAAAALVQANWEPIRQFQKELRRHERERPEVETGIVN